VVHLLNFQTSLEALKIHQKYQYSYYDSLIIASALENQCDILYSEDMQHQQLIENRLLIFNPFL
jgi:predicted nucleic acid-binding protein